MKHIVSMKWLLEHMAEPNVLVADCRFLLGEPTAGLAAYKEGHIPGAVYFDLERDLSSPKAEHGGRHPLPQPDVLAQKLGDAGVDASVKVVAYDDQGGSMASRLWWLLRYLGHEQAYVLDEGFSAWQQAGYPVTTDIFVREPKTFTLHLQTSMVADVDEVRAAVNTQSALLLDSRDYRRYTGIEETIDPVGGHIPGAAHYFWKENLKQETKWKEADELQSRFQSLEKEKPFIVYCGSGITACPNVLALSEAGFDQVKLYAGSWSDWISYEDNPIATGEE